jgi:hypothetical protein
MDPWSSVMITMTLGFFPWDWEKTPWEKIKKSTVKAMPKGFLNTFIYLYYFKFYSSQLLSGTTPVITIPVRENVVLMDAPFGLFGNWFNYRKELWINLFFPSIISISPFSTKKRSYFLFPN